MYIVWSTLLLLLIAAAIHQWALRFKLPYTICLFAVWLLIWLGNIRLPGHWQVSLELTPDLLFFVFLPVLIFESGYNMKYYALKRDYLPIWSLATIGLLISTIIIARWGQRLLRTIGIDLPIEVMLLFGVIISSTDPVAILSIAKEMWLPKRLRLMLEGESLFNDGTAVALFLIILEAIRNPLTFTSWIGGLLTFIGMIIGGIVLWVAIGVWFSYVIRTIKNNEHTEIALTMILAHLTFLLAERISHTEFWGITIHVSGIIATAYAAIILGNFWKTKISPKVEHYMEKFRWFFSFVCNSLVFLLMWMMVQKIWFPHTDVRIIIWIITLLVLWARMFSVFSTLTPLNFFLKKPISPQWQFLIWRSGLRWALALVIAILIPDTLSFPWRTLSSSPKELIMLLIISSILVSLLFQWLTVKSLIKRMNIDKLYDLEEFEKYESQIVVYQRIIEKLEQMKLGYTISEKSYDLLYQKYTNKIAEAVLQLQLFLQQQSAPALLLKKALTLHALGIEKDYLKEMFRYNEIPENLYHYQLTKIELQAARVKSNDDQIRWFNKPLEDKKNTRDPILRLMGKLQHTDHCAHDEFILNRTRVILASKVIAWMHTLQAIDFWYEDKRSAEIIERYQIFYDRALQQLKILEDEDEHIAICVESALLNKWLAKTEEIVIDELLHKEMITEKLHSMFMEEVESEVWKRY
jgi:CPA1 family monovalent cation:H+ antiporter